MSTCVDLNADVGESLDPENDRPVLRLVTSVNVACGRHAGTPHAIRAAMVLAREYGVAVGAHPSFDDRSGFGRREMRIAPAALIDLVRRQLVMLMEIAVTEGVRVRHVKPHGALYNMAAKHRAYADAVARATVDVDASLMLVGLSGSGLLEAGRQVGLRTVAEAFADRAYEADGSLRERSLEGAVIHEPMIVARRAVAMVRDAAVTAIDGSRLALRIDTLCVHGDTPGAAEIAGQLRAELDAAGIIVRACP